MKYQLIEWKDQHLSIYEVTDDLKMERLLWSGKRKFISYWDSYVEPTNMSISKVEWISKEEVFTIML